MIKIFDDYLETHCFSILRRNDINEIKKSNIHFSETTLNMKDKHGITMLDIIIKNKNSELNNFIINRFIKLNYQEDRINLYKSLLSLDCDVKGVHRNKF